MDVQASPKQGTPPIKRMVALERGLLGRDTISMPRGPVQTLENTGKRLKSAALTARPRPRTPACNAPTVPPTRRRDPHSEWPRQDAPPCKQRRRSAARGIGDRALARTT